MERSKREIRRQVLHVRDSLSAWERERGTVILTERILGHQWFYRAEALLCYVSYGSEIGTQEILREALRLGKRVYVPKVLGEGQMAFYRIRGLDELQEGYRGIPEPSGASEAFDCRAEEGGQVLMLMPGVAFDGRQNRLGYGKGFYDRFLSEWPWLQQHTIAVGYLCQMTEAFPVEAGDRKPCQVICV